MITPKSTNRSATDKVHNAISDSNLSWKDIPLNGKCITSTDGTLLGLSDFQTLTNFEYTDASIRSITGMTKINSTAPTYLKHRNIFQFNKTNPVESHLLTQSYNSAENASIIQQMTQSVPSTGDFSATSLYTVASVWTASTAYTIGNKVLPTTNNGYYYECSDAGTSHTTEPTWPTTEFNSVADNTCRWVCKVGDLSGVFSKAPDGCMAYANGNDVLVWGGDEYRVAKFINYDPADVFFYDYTDRVNNSSTRTEDIAVLKPTTGGIDSATELLLHFEDNVTDSSANAITITAVGTPAYTASGKFLKAMTFDGVNDYIWADDDAVFDFSGGSWCIDAWVDTTSVAVLGTLYWQATVGATATDHFKISITTSGAVTLSIYAAAVETLFLSTAAGVITTAAGYQHIEIEENGNDYYIFVNGILKAYTSSPIRAADYDGLVCIGAENDYVNPLTNYIAANIDEFRVSSVYRNTNNFTPMTSVYGADSKTYLYLCSMLPISGIKFYLATPNTTTCATPTINYWNGSAWTTVGTVTDGTLSGGKTLAQTGRMTFTDTQSVAKQKSINSNIGFWYQLIFASIDNTTGVYYCTFKTNMQKAKDVWDGENRDCVSCQVYDGSSFTDNTTNVLKPDAQTYYDGTDWIYPPETYCDLAPFTSSYALYLGFLERQTGVSLTMPHDKVNTNAATVTIYYWNGASWTTVGTVDDQTLDPTNAKSINHSGHIIWSPVDEVNEYKTTVSTNVELYYYKLVWNANISDDAKLDYVTGIAAPVKVEGYNAPIMWLGSLWLVGQKDGEKNKIKSTMINTVCVFNGKGSNEKYVGSNEEIITGCCLFSRFLNNMEETMILLKKDEVWIMDGSNPENIRPYKVSSQYGITGKYTLSVCDIGVEISAGVNKSVAIWQSSNGIMMFDNGSLITISADIDNYFTDMYNTDKTERLNPNAVEKSIGFYDPLDKCYHWCFAAGTSTTLNREWVYDIIRKKWFRIDRTKYLQAGDYVQDVDGNTYTYGCIDTGYVERLNYGNTFDGTDITSTFRLADKPLHTSMFTESDIRKLKIIGVVNSSAATFTLYWYADSSSTGTSLGVVDQSQTGMRIYQRPIDVNQKAVFNGVGGVCVSNDSFHACEPLAIGYLYKNIRLQTNRRES